MAVSSRTPPCRCCGWQVSWHGTQPTVCATAKAKQAVSSLLSSAIAGEKPSQGSTELCWVICPLLEPRACCEPEPRPRQALAERGCDVAVVPPVKRFPPRLERAESLQ